MDDEMFNELAESVREGLSIMRGEIKPSRIFHCSSCDRHRYIILDKRFDCSINKQYKFCSKLPVKLKKTKAN